MKYYLLIKNGIVEAVATNPDQGYLDAVASRYDFVLETNHAPGDPDVGWTYDGQNFSPPVE